MRRKVIITLGVALASGCAGGGGADTPSDDVSPDQGVELVVRNESQSLVTAFAQWDSGPQVRLGELAAGTSGAFTVPVRGQSLAVRFCRGRGGCGRQAVGTGTFARRGDRLEFALLVDGRRTWVQRLPPR